VSQVIDGDTLRVAGPGPEDVVRLVGINAPGHGECWASEATAALAELVGVGPVRLERDVSDRDRYGRLLRYVITPDGEDAGGLLIDGGHAIARAYPPDTSRDAAYRERQRVAREAGRGAWARDACGAGPASRIDPDGIGIEVHPDAAGDDSQNLNDEWVRFTNLTADPLDLEGWMVRDESSSHRYRFDALVLAPGAPVTLRSGCGADTVTDRYWCVSGSAVWNNAGDTVFLLDPTGNVVAELGYPVPAQAPGPSGWP
jgi:micrococcal nuclease